MYVRLAFAVAAHLEPEILLVDEVLAVGDAAFQKKCLGKMGSVASEGRTVLFVSHNMATIHSLCPRSLLLGQGNKIFDGVTEEAIQLYLSTSTTQGEAFIPSETPRMGSGVARFDAVRIFNEEGQITNSIFMGSNFSVEIDFHCLKPVENINFDVSIRGPMQERILQFSSQVTQGKMPSASHGGSVRLFIENLNLLPGSYYITITMTRKGEKIDMVENILKLDVTPQGIYETGKLPRYGNALIYLPCHWQAKYT
jgi:lipopolysaccharide transport system ATP-binding protein